MEEGWERRTPALTLDHAAIAALLRPYAGEAALGAVELLGGGLVNTNYKVTLAGQAAPVVLRVYVRDPAACATEAALLRLVRGEVPVPDVLYASIEGDRPYVVLSWVEGVKPHTVLGSASDGEAEAIGHACGFTLAHIGRHTFAASGFFGPNLSIAEPLGRAREWAPVYIEQQLFAERGAARLGTDLAERARRLLAENLALLDEADGPARLVHGDYKSVNLLLRRPNADSPDWALSGVLDWEFAFASTPLLDLAILLRESERMPRGFERGVVRGFRAAGGDLPASWKRITRLLDLTNLSGFLAAEHPREAQIRDVIALIQATVDHWDDYAPGAYPIS